MLSLHMRIMAREYNTQHLRQHEAASCRPGLGGVVFTGITISSQPALALRQS
jgi:hypothetical protein